MVLGIITGILVLIIFTLRFIPFIPLEIKIEWITYVGLILMFFTGGTAWTLFKNSLIAIITGAVTFAIIMALLQTLA